MKPPDQTGAFTALAVASGKGGVGKTMLSVALAYELSQNAPTLIIDLDFFNRGLTGLLRSGKVVKELVAPRLLPEFSLAPSPTASIEEEEAATPNPEHARWEVVEISENLFNLRYPDLSTSDYAKIENTPIEELAESLSNYITYATRECGAHFVVLDCHGGPDRTSFAACKIAKTTLLISEPDRITLYGTLNFLRQLADAGGTTEDHDIRLVLNKVVSSFNAPFLLRFYNENIRSEFGGKPLLAMFPMEEYLTKAFERNALLAKVYPESLLARKTRAYIYDLLLKSNPDHLSPDLKGLSRFERQITRTTLGREFILLNNDFAIATIFSIAMIFMTVGIVAENGRGILGIETTQVLRDFIDVFFDTPNFAIVLVLWFLLTLFRRWMRRLSRASIFLARTGRRLRSWLAALAKSLVVTPLVVMAGLLFLAIDDEIRYSSAESFADFAVSEDGFGMVAALLFALAFLAEYYFYNLKRATRLRRYRQFSKSEGIANATAIILPLIISAPLWSVLD